MTEGQPTEEDIKNMSPEEISELQKKNCVFCKIIAGEVPSHKVYEDDKIIALLDIYPAAKGHVLIMPKEHTPIMPLIKTETFKYMFRNIKYITNGVKKGTPSSKSTIFIANGATAGQQSPHFLFHVIPRDEEDGLEILDMPSKNVSQDELTDSLKNNLTAMMHNHLKREGKMIVQAPSKEKLADFLEKNPDLKAMLINNPEEVKKGLDSNPQLKLLFIGVDIDKLSEKLKEIEGNKEEHKVEPPKEEEHKEEHKEEDIPEEKEEEPAKEDKEQLKDEEDEKHDLDSISGLFTK